MENNAGNQHFLLFDIFPTVLFISVVKIRDSLVNSFPNDKFLYSSKLKEFADGNFKFDENGRKCSKWVENTVRKG